MDENTIIEDPAAPEPPPALIAVARLDAEGIYQGIDLIPADQVAADHVPLPDGCDLPPGRYAWDRAQKTFAPLASPQQRAVEAPVALNALAWGLLAQYDTGMVLPPPCLDWLDYYVRTIDFGYATSPLLQRYVAERKLK